MSKTHKNLLFAGLAIVLLVVAGYRQVGYASREGLPTQATTNSICLACQKEVAVTAEITDRPPWVCPLCGERAVYPWIYCYRCKMRFVPELVRYPGQPPKMPAIPACPKCGRTETGACLADDPEQPVEGDLPLPKWP